MNNKSYIQGLPNIYSFEDYTLGVWKEFYVRRSSNTESFVASTVPPLFSSLPLLENSRLFCKRERDIERENHPNEEFQLTRFPSPQKHTHDFPQKNQTQHTHNVIHCVLQSYALIKFGVITY